MILSRKNVLVTGATGFIGSRLVRKLISFNNCVHIVVRRGSSLAQLEGVIDLIFVHEYDGSIESLEGIMKKSSPDIVYHLASLFLSSHKSSDIESLVDSNILFGIQLLEVVKKFNIRRFVNTGTSWQHFDGEGYNPVNLYAATKQAFEDIARYYVESSADFKFTTLKIFDTYGPGDARGKLVSLLIECIYSKDEISLSPGEQFLDLVYIDDVIDAFILSGSMLFDADSGQSFSCYSISSKKLIKIKELVSVIENISEKQINVNLGGRPYRDREVMKAQGIDPVLPGWKPKFNIRMGLEKTIHFEQESRNS